MLIRHILRNLCLSKNVLISATNFQSDDKTDGDARSQPSDTTSASSTDESMAGGGLDAPTEQDRMDEPTEPPEHEDSSERGSDSTGPPSTISDLRRALETSG